MDAGAVGPGRRGEPTDAAMAKVVRSRAEVQAQEPFRLVEHRAVAVGLLAEGEAEQVVEDLDGDQAAGLKTWRWKAVASPQQIVEPGGEVEVVPSLRLLEFWAAPSVVERVPEARFLPEELAAGIDDLLDEGTGPIGKLAARRPIENVDEVVEPARKECLNDAVFVREEPVQAADRDPGTLGDEPGPHLVVGELPEQLGSGREYPAELVTAPRLLRLTSRRLVELLHRAAHLTILTDELNLN